MQRVQKVPRMVMMMINSLIIVGFFSQTPTSEDLLWKMQDFFQFGNLKVLSEHNLEK